MRKNEQRNHCVESLTHSPIVFICLMSIGIKAMGLTMGKNESFIYSFWNTGAFAYCFHQCSYTSLVYLMTQSKYRTLCNGSNGGHNKIYPFGLLPPTLQPTVEQRLDVVAAPSPQSEKPESANGMLWSIRTWQI